MKPYPPWICTPSFAHRTATSPEYNLAIDDSNVVFNPASFMQAARMVSRRAASISVAMSASFHCMAWNSLMAWPNCLRCLEYLSAASYAPCAIPSPSAAMEMRPPSSTRMASTNPLPSMPSKASSGTQQSSKTSSEVSLARSPSLFSFLPGRNPLAPFSTTNADSPCVCAVLSVTAITTLTSAYVPLVMNVLVPFNAHPPLARVALMRAPPASEPEPGSVNPQAPSISPVASRETYFFFCSSLPARKIWLEQSELCAATVMPIEPSTRESSSIAITYST